MCVCVYIYIYIYIYIHNGSMKYTRNSFLQFLSLILSTRYQSLGLRIEEFLREILVSTDKGV